MNERTGGCYSKLLHVALTFPPGMIHPQRCCGGRRGEIEGFFTSNELHRCQVHAGPLELFLGQPQKREPVELPASREKDMRYCRTCENKITVCCM